MSKLIHCKTLEINILDLKNLSIEEQKQFIRKKFLELCLQYHPDKNPQDSEKIKAIIAAYKALSSSLDSTTSLSHETTKSTPTNIDIPDTAFDLLLEEGIITAYEALQKERLKIENDRERAAFERYYQAFFDLAKSLEEVQSKLAHQRVEHLYAKNNSLKIILIQEWRELIIRLFGEEYLTDFQYRHALATGDLLPILATRKLLSPVKWVATLFISLIRLMTLSVNYAFEKRQTHQLKNLLEACFNPDGSWIRVAFEFFKMVAPAILFVGSLYLAPVPTILVFGLPAMSSWTEIIASPVNKIIRPLSNYTRIPAPIWFGIMIGLTVLGVCGLIFSNILPTLALILSVCSIGFNIYTMYAFAAIIYKTYKQSPALSVIMLSSTILSLALSTLFPPEIGAAMLDQMSLFFYSMANATVLYSFNKLIDNPSKAQIQELENLPLPEGAIPETIQTSTLIGYQAATQSARFFNTAKDAKCLNKDEQTFGQKTLSFFGSGKQDIQLYHPPYEENEQPFETGLRLIA